MSNLNPKQQRFVQEYLKDLNGTQAAIRAGYSKKTARQIGQHLLTKVDIRAAVQAGQKKAAERAEVSVEYVITKLRKLAEDAMSDADRTNAIRSLELLGKHVGAFTENLSIRGNLSNLSDEEIERRIQEELAARGERLALLEHGRQ